MARFVFFSFDYTDVGNFRVNVVRNSWLLKNKQETFVDGSIWETAKGKGDAYLKGLIEEGLNRTSVTAVLIGQGTANRRWVNYEIVKSFERGNGILGVHINRIRGKDGYIVSRGANPLDRLGLKVSEEGKKVNFYELKNGRWVEYADLPQINNKKSNTLYFEDSFWFGNDYGEFYTFSQKFKTHCWDFDEGKKNFIDWVGVAAEEAGR
ncbi:MAG: TIR domain-containing protein [Lacibacter sp.]|jgi:hypothetical protein